MNDRETPKGRQAAAKHAIESEMYWHSVTAKNSSWPEGPRGIDEAFFLWSIISTVLHLVIPMGLCSPCLGRVLNAKSKHVLNWSLKIPCSSTDPCQNKAGMDFSHR